MPLGIFRLDLNPHKDPALRANLERIKRWAESVENRLSVVVTQTTTEGTDPPVIIPQPMLTFGGTEDVLARFHVDAMGATQLADSIVRQDSGATRGFIAGDFALPDEKYLFWGSGSGVAASARSAGVRWHAAGQDPDRFEFDTGTLTRFALSDKQRSTTGSLGFSEALFDFDETVSYATAPATATWRGLDIGGTVAVGVVSGGGGPELITNGNFEGTTFEDGNFPRAGVHHSNPDHWPMTPVTALIATPGRDGTGSCIAITPGGNATTRDQLTATDPQSYVWPGTSSNGGVYGCSDDPGGPGIPTGTRSYISLAKNKVYSLTFYAKLSGAGNAKTLKIGAYAATSSTTFGTCTPATYFLTGISSTGGQTIAAPTWSSTSSDQLQFDSVLDNATWLQYTVTVDTSTIGGSVNDPFYFVLEFFGPASAGTFSIDDVSLKLPSTALSVPLTERALTLDQLIYVPTLSSSGDTLTLTEVTGAYLVPNMAPSIASGATATLSAVYGAVSGFALTGSATGLTATNVFSHYFQRPGFGTNAYNIGLAANSTFFTAFKTGTQAASLAYTLPTGITPSGFLMTDMAGTLSWTSIPGAGSGTSGSPPTALAGEDGEDGWPGPPGAQGAVGVQGAIGPPGADGEDGEPGPPGVPGVAGAAGAAGATGAAGAQGTAGPPGQDGDEGADGVPGVPGAPGAVGATGALGPPGFDGEEGPEGIPGMAGIAGATGTPGTPGPAGDDGSCDCILLGLPSNYYDACGITYTPAVVANWNSGADPGQTCNALDQLAANLNPLLPSAAPAISHVSFTNAPGVSGKNTWNAAQPIASYANAPSGVTGSVINSGDALDVTVGTSGTGKGVMDFDTQGTEVGVLADTTAAGPGSPTTAYPALSFSPGGTDGGATNDLKILLNGVVLQTVNLRTFGSGTSTNANGSGFTSLSAATPCRFPDGSSFTPRTFRTGNWVVGLADQTRGWNVISIQQVTDSGTATTNVWEFLLDADNTATTITAETAATTLAGWSHATTKSLSGVKYTSGSVTVAYSSTVNNIYRNTYVSGTAITDGSTNASIASLSPTTLSASGGNEALTVAVTGTATWTSSGRLLDVSVIPKITTARTVQGSVTSTGVTTPRVLYDNVTATSTDTSEGFDDENYRMRSNLSLTSTAYISGGGGSGSPAVWDSTQSLTAGSAGHTTGLLVYNSVIQYPTQGANAGNFGGITNAEAGNPDYSAATGSRTYLRYFFVGAGVQNFTFTITKVSATSFVSVATGVSAQALTFEVLAPNTTQNGSAVIEFKDALVSYTTNDAIGCQTSSSGTGSGGTTTTLACTLGTRSTSTSGNAIVIRITSAAAWTGSLSATLEVTT